MWVETPEVKFVDLKREDFFCVKSGNIYQVTDAPPLYEGSSWLSAIQWKDGKWYGPIRGFGIKSKIVRVVWVEDSKQ